MDWISWLSKTGLDPSAVYDYALIFIHNQLEEDDVAYLNHEILLSMGISIAKHRLEILKLARKTKKKRDRSIHPMSWLIVAIKQTKNYLAKQVHAWVRREDSSLAIVSKRNHVPSMRWKVAMLKSNKRWMAAASQERHVFPYEGQEILMLTNGSPLVDPVPWNNSYYSSPMVLKEKVVEDVDDEYAAHVVEDIQWDAMFQDLKPT